MFADHRPSSSSTTSLTTSPEEENGDSATSTDQYHKLRSSSHDLFPNHQQRQHSEDEIYSDPIATSASPSSSSLSLSGSSSRENLDVFDGDRAMLENKSSSVVSMERMKPLQSGSDIGSSLDEVNSMIDVKPLHSGSADVERVNSSNVVTSSRADVNSLQSDLTETSRSADQKPTALPEEERQSRQSHAAAELSGLTSSLQHTNQSSIDGHKQGIPTIKSLPSSRVSPQDNELDDMLTVSNIVVGASMTEEERPALRDASNTKSNEEEDGGIDDMANVPSEPLVVSEEGASNDSCLDNQGRIQQSRIIVNGKIERNECHVVVATGGTTSLSQQLLQNRGEEEMGEGAGESFVCSFIYMCFFSILYFKDQNAVDG